MSLKPITQDELSAMEEQLEFEQKGVTKAILDTLEVKYKEEGTADAMFEYGAYLIRSPIRDDRTKGLDLLKRLKVTTKVAEEAHFFLIKGQWWDGNYVDAQKEVEEFVGLYPTNRRGLILAEIVKQKVQHDGYVGIALGVGVAALGVAALGVARALSK